MNLKAHWETVYRTKRPDEVSWYQRNARTSRELIERVATDRAARILDVGGGASTLVDALLSSGYSDLTVLDVSSTALEAARRRLGDRAAGVTWLEADVLTHAFPSAAFDVWHDRAVFHFLTAARDRERYVEQVRRAMRPGGYVLVATFAESGPTKCSGLPVARYTPDALHAVFGSGFRLLESTREDHVTPSGAIQPFVYCVCRFELRARDHVAA